MCRSFGQQIQDQNELNEQPKKKRTFTNEESRIIKNFKIVMDHRKNTADSPSQYRIACEIQEISTQNISFNQSMVSHLYNGIDIPKCDRTITAINNWIDKELEKKENQENLNRETIYAGIPKYFLAILCKIGNLSDSYHHLKGSDSGKFCGVFISSKYVDVFSFNSSGHPCICLDLGSNTLTKIVALESIEFRSSSSVKQKFLSKMVI
ncbi:unnamed protein product [Rhizophagus irregularis]|nr:unnamed protein product [Rhizophagus irregularis]